MKSIFIVYNQTNTERVAYMLKHLGIRGYTQWQDVMGVGSETGEPRMGTQTWPEMNSALMAIVPDEKVKEVLDAVRRLDKRNEEVGIRAFVWNIEQSI